MKSWYGILAVLGGCSYGILSTFVKIAYTYGFTPGEVVGAQYFAGFLMMAVMVLVMRKRLKKRSSIIKLILSGIPMALTGLFYYQSLQYLGASIAIILLFQYTWMGLVLEWLLHRTVPDRQKLVALLFLVAGSLLSLDMAGSSLSNLPLMGIFWGLLAAASFTGFVHVSGSVANEEHPLVKSMIMSAGALLIISLIYPPAFLYNGALAAGLWKWGLFLGFFGVVVPPLLFSISIPKLGSGLGTILTASELPMAVVMSAIVLKESIAFLQWAGILLVLIGIALPNVLGHRMRIRNE